MPDEIKIRFTRLSQGFDNIDIPAYATEDSSGMDIRAAIKIPVTITHLGIEIIPTNISVEIPRGFEIQVRPRSGLAAKNGIGIINSPGTIDADYRGEIKIILINYGKEDFTVNPGDRIAQLVVSKVYKVSLDEAENLNTSKRGKRGFGHTGKS
ncbi:MAG: dUTP diphosphatase [Ignavibacteria bacterium]|jgi:dUTP pyrophosphatase